MYIDADRGSTQAEPGERLSDVPPSAKLVHWVLERKGPATQGQIAEKTLLPPRTVRSALDELASGDLVREEVYFQDARKRIYYALPVRTE